MAVYSDAELDLVRATMQREMALALAEADEPLQEELRAVVEGVRRLSTWRVCPR